MIQPGQDATPCSRDNDPHLGRDSGGQRASEKTNADPTEGVAGRGAMVRLLEISDISILEELKIAPKALAHIGLLLGILAGLLAPRGGTWQGGVAHAKARWASAHLGGVMLLK